MSTFGNGGFNPIPGGNIFNPSVSNGTYGFIHTNSLCNPWANANTTVQLHNTTTLKKGDGYVAVYHDGKYSYTLDQNGNPTNGGFRFG